MGTSWKIRQNSAREGPEVTRDLLLQREVLEGDLRGVTSIVQRYHGEQLTD